MRGRETQRRRMGRRSGRGRQSGNRGEMMSMIRQRGLKGLHTHTLGGVILDPAFRAGRYIFAEVNRTSFLDFFAVSSSMRLTRWFCSRRSLCVTASVRKSITIARSSRSTSSCASRVCSSSVDAIVARLRLTACRGCLLRAASRDVHRGQWLGCFSCEIYSSAQATRPLTVRSRTLRPLSARTPVLTLTSRATTGTGVG